MTTLRTLPFVLALALAAPSARAAVVGGTLPDGTYHCEVYLLGDFLSLGDIAIKGSVYSGPSFGVPRTAMPAYNYQIDPNGEIAWLGPVGGFTQGGNAIALTQVTAGVRDFLNPQGEGDALTFRLCEGLFIAKRA